jgi:hypothetical protein
MFQLQIEVDVAVVPVHRLSHDQSPTLDQTVNLSKKGRQAPGHGQRTTAAEFNTL